MKERKRIWIPESLEALDKPIVELPSIEIGGYYYVDLIDAKTGKIKQHLEFPNIITDTGLNFVGTGTSLTSLYTILAVGTSATLPTVSDTALGAKIATSSNDGGVADVDSTESTPREFSFRRRTRIFTETEAVGSLRELGWEVGGVLANRALFKDLNGAITTVEKTSNDVLQVVYEYRIFAPLNDVTGTFTPTLGSSSVDYVLRAQNVNANNGWPNLLDNMGSYSTPEARAHETAVIGSRTGNNDPSPQSSESTSSLEAYVAGTFFRDMNYRWTFADANFGSFINLVTWNPWNSAGDLMIWQMFFSSSVEKTINDRFDVTFRQRWTRV